MNSSMTLIDQFIYHLAMPNDLKQKAWRTYPSLAAPRYRKSSIENAGVATSQRLFVVLLPDGTVVVPSVEKRL
jgi:hypothetical protein